MDDLYFEKTLMKNERNNVCKELDNYIVNFSGEKEVSKITKEVYGKFSDILYNYYNAQYDEKKSWNLINEFEKKLCDDSLKEKCKVHNFLNDEINFIRLTNLQSKWRQKSGYKYKAKYAVTDVLLRNIIIDVFGTNEIEKLKKMIINDYSNNLKYIDDVKHYTELLSDKPFGNVDEKLNNEIDVQAKHSFNESINCGGYALKIDKCIYPTYQDSFDKSVSSILDRFSFVRLLGDKKIKDDEYLVIYRAPEGKNKGHHFIRVDSDGLISEKDGSGPVRKFENWGSLENAKETIFAVKKEHKMFRIFFERNKF